MDISELKSLIKELAGQGELKKAIDALIKHAPFRKIRKDARSLKKELLELEKLDYERRENQRVQNRGYDKILGEVIKLADELKHYQNKPIRDLAESHKWRWFLPIPCVLALFFISSSSFFFFVDPIELRTGTIEKNTKTHLIIIRSKLGFFSTKIDPLKLECSASVSNTRLQLKYTVDNIKVEGKKSFVKTREELIEFASERTTIATFERAGVYVFEIKVRCENSVDPCLLTSIDDVDTVIKKDGTLLMARNILLSNIVIRPFISFLILMVVFYLSIIGEYYTNYWIKAFLLRKLEKNIIFS